MAHRSDRCLNCGQPTPHAFCAHCGQANTDHRESLHELAGEVAQELFQLDSRAAHTVVPFLFQPGTLTREYNAGRRVRYSSPLRILLVFSVAYFFTLSVLPMTGHLYVEPHGIGLVYRPSHVTDGGVDASVDEIDVDTGELPTDELVSFRADEAGDGGTPNWVSAARERASAAWGARSPEERTRHLLDNLVGTASKLLFLLLPIFGLLLALIFRKPRRFYVEHLVFAMHYHAYVFLLLIAGYFVPGMAPALVLVALGYLVVALRTTYARSWMQTSFRALLLVGLYVVILLLALVATFGIAWLLG